jgi:hypothetical protein
MESLAKKDEATGEVTAPLDHPKANYIHTHPTGMPKKMVGDLKKTCHTAGHEKTTSSNRQ